MNLAKLHDKKSKKKFYIGLYGFPFMFLAFVPLLVYYGFKFALPAHLFHPARLIILGKLPSCSFIPSCAFIR